MVAGAACFMGQQKPSGLSGAKGLKADNKGNKGSNIK